MVHQYRGSMQTAERHKRFGQLFVDFQNPLMRRIVANVHDRAPRWRTSPAELSVDGAIYSLKRTGEVRFDGA